MMSITDCSKEEGMCSLVDAVSLRCLDLSIRNRNMKVKQTQRIQEARGGGGGEGDSHMKGAGMLVVSLRGVIFGFWSHLGCSGQNAIIFSRQGLV